MVLCFCMVCVQFDGERNMTLCGGAPLPPDIPATHILSKLALLVLHFPALKVLWARDCDATVALVTALKVRVIDMYR